MKKKILTIILFVFIMSVKASSNTFVIKDINFNKEEQIISKLPEENTLSYKIEYEDKNKDVIDLSKKVTYLLLGPSNGKESVEDYYKRHKDFLNIRYSPDIPVVNGKEDTNSQEYKDSLVTSISTSIAFESLNNLGINYSTFGDIIVSESKDYILSTVILPSITMKKEDLKDSTKYDLVRTNLVIYYFFKENKGSYKLFFVLAESNDNIDDYLNNINENSNNTINIVKDYDSTLNNMYNITNLKKITNNTINNIYESNKDKIVKLVSFYKDGSSFIGNGFFINKGIVVTTWDYLKRALLNGEYINVINNNKSYKVEGIVTINKDSNIAVLKLTSEVSSGITLANNVNIGDPVISISSQVIGYKANKGLIVTDNGYFQSTIPMSQSDEGSLLFNSKGEVVGMNTAILVNSPSSFSVPYKAIKEVQDKFKSYSDLKVISFEELKKDYYVDYGVEEKDDNLSKSTWNKINKITDISNNIHMQIVKANENNGTISIRYKNNLSDTVSPMKMGEGFRNSLLNNNWIEVLNSDKKCIYVKDNYQVTLIEEFNYLIVIMVI